MLLYICIFRTKKISSHYFISLYYFIRIEKYITVLRLSNYTKCIHSKYNDGIRKEKDGRVGKFEFFKTPKVVSN